jgi:pimeloyl-ACP methyl ester carboxylesterase
MLTPPQPARQLRRPVGAVAAVALLLVGCGSEPASPQPSGGAGVLSSYDRGSGTLARCPDEAVGPAERPVVLVHGLFGGTKSLRPLLTFLARQPELRGRPLLVFAYPSSGGLARAAQALHDEMRRVVADPAGATFVCHSAGGLVFRHYAEVLGGPFDRAVLLGTPHRGSALAGLGPVRGASGAAAAVRQLLPEKAAARMPGLLDRTLTDVRPGSAFLRQLGPGTDDCYDLFGGEWVSRPQSMAVEATFLAARSLLRGQAERIPLAALRALALSRLDRLRLPAELTLGDLVVAADSACPPGAGRVTRLRASHRALRADERVLKRVLSVVVGEPPR